MLNDLSIPILAPLSGFNPVERRRLSNPIYHDSSKKGMFGVLNTLVMLMHQDDVMHDGYLAFVATGVIARPE